MPDAPTDTDRQRSHKHATDIAVLIVDDEEPIRRVLKRVLEQQHTVEFARSVDEARDKIATQHYGLILCDITMPGESGVELLRTVASDAPNTVVVMVTGIDDPEIAEQAVALGVYGYLVKPFTANEVRITVATALRRRTLELERDRLIEHERELRLLADRERIGRDLHDNVIQRLFAMGLSLQAVAPLVSDQKARQRVETAVEDLDVTIRQIRTTIFEVQSGRRPSVRGSVIDLVRETAVTLGFQPTVTFSGAIDTLVGDHAADQLLATLRESLSNVARHASAQHVHVDVVIDRDLALTVRDDGTGLRPTEPNRPGGMGLTNMRARAEQLGGSMTIAPRSEGGTQLEWRIPLDRA
jgi:signal transduction histidine kinase